MDWVSKQWAQRAELPSHVVNLLNNLPAQKVHPMSQFAAAITACNTESKFMDAYTRGVKKSEYWEVIIKHMTYFLAKLIKTKGIVREAIPEIYWQNCEVSIHKLRFFVWVLGVSFTCKQKDVIFRCCRSGQFFTFYLLILSFDCLYSFIICSPGRSDFYLLSFKSGLVLE